MDRTQQSGETQFFVYVLGSRREADCRTYVGWTTVLERRLRQHNSGVGAKSTRGRQWIILYSEQCETRSKAMSREWYIKRDRAFRKTLLVAMSTECTGAAATPHRESRGAERPLLRDCS